jgi:hypothetical protein
MFSNKCKFWKVCEGYRKDAVTCNKDQEKRYCGTYRNLEYEEMKRENR